MKNTPGWISVHEAACRLNVSHMTLSDLIFQNQLPVKDCGARRLVSLAAVEDRLAYQRQRDQKLRIFTVINDRRGMGKTTTAYALSHLCAAEYATLAVDVDNQSDLTALLGFQEDALKYSMGDWLVPACFRKSLSLSDVLCQTALSHLALLPSSSTLPYHLLYCRDYMYVERQFRKELRPFLDNYERIILDAPWEKTSVAIGAVTVATDILIPMDVAFCTQQAIIALENWLVWARDTVTEPYNVWVFAYRSDASSPRCSECVKLPEGFRECTTVIGKKPVAAWHKSPDKPEAVNGLLAAYSPLLEEISRVSSHPE